MRKLIPLVAVTCLAACGSDPQETAPNATAADATAPVETPAPAATATPLPDPSATPAAESSATASTAADGRVSRYTSLTDCRVVRSAPDEAGFSESTCPGMGSYRLKLVEADGRQSLKLVSGGKEHGLEMSSIAGGGFTEIGKRIEWRGRGTDGAFQPDAMILRYDVVENFDQPGRPTSYLLPVSLERTPCLTAKIRPGAGQNDRARAAADGPAKCL
ncbi:hypothetical protein [Sphingomonas desiccabilis]|uniref:Uncharacterized protein n=1 Tax=Sphingomonas desiccabilis TaxID=429134 RepID=A0A4Q2IMH2_9SPHN|nr:hypothetical protein [Sphingomonas desiccabilis]MBB3912287.1 hypothetical protein [Sphingomonas desiccabilis]RXZ30439.1 hypothetical protein EO081_14690 [Sphingomonas desiccabilis]